MKAERAFFIESSLIFMTYWFVFLITQEAFERTWFSREHKYGCRDNLGPGTTSNFHKNVPISHFFWFKRYIVLIYYDILALKSITYLKNVEVLAWTEQKDSSLDVQIPYVFPPISECYRFFSTQWLMLFSPFLPNQITWTVFTSDLKTTMMCWYAQTASKDCLQIPFIWN